LNGSKGRGDPLLAAGADTQPLAEPANAFSQALAEVIAQRVAEILRSQPAVRPDCQPPSPWLTLDQAGEYLGLSHDSVYKLTAARAIPCRKKIKGQGLRFRRDELDAWMETRYPRVDRLA
jgi:excisionase family DNA binding protein